jgi:hypothetical protein
MLWHLYVFSKRASKCFGINRFFQRKLTHALVFICSFLRKLTNALKSICFSKGANKCFRIFVFSMGAKKCFGIYMFFPRKLTNALVSTHTCFSEGANKSFGIFLFFSS